MCDFCNKIYNEEKLNNQYWADHEKSIALHMMKITTFIAFGTNAKMIITLGILWKLSIAPYVEGNCK